MKEVVHAIPGALLFALLLPATPRRRRLRRAIALLLHLCAERPLSGRVIAPTHALR